MGRQSEELIQEELNSQKQANRFYEL